MTVGAVLEIELPRRFDSLVLDEVRSPGHLVRVHVKESRLRVERGAAPFRSTVEPGEDDRLLVNSKRHELRASVERPETLDSPLVRLRSPIRQHILRQRLPG